MWGRIPLTLAKSFTENRQIQLIHKNKEGNPVTFFVYQAIGLFKELHSKSFSSVSPVCVAEEIKICGI